MAPLLKTTLTALILGAGLYAQETPTQPELRDLNGDGRKDRVYCELPGMHMSTHECKLYWQEGKEDGFGPEILLVTLPEPTSDTATYSPELFAGLLGPRSNTPSKFQAPSSPSSRPMALFHDINNDGRPDMAYGFCIQYIGKERECINFWRENQGGTFSLPKPLATLPTGAVQFNYNGSREYYPGLIPEE